MPVVWKSSQNPFHPSKEQPREIHDLTMTWVQGSDGVPSSKTQLIENFQQLRIALRRSIGEIIVERDQYSQTKLGLQNILAGFIRNRAERDRGITLDQKLAKQSGLSIGSDVRHISFDFTKGFENTHDSTSARSSRDSRRLLKNTG